MTPRRDGDEHPREIDIHTAAAPTAASNHDDADYSAFLSRLQLGFTQRAGMGPLFTTDASGLWDSYLSAFPLHSRQYHNCNACRHFIERFGGIVTIDERGIAWPVMWQSAEGYGELATAIAIMQTIVGNARVTGVFLSPFPVWGTPQTGEWTHLHVRYAGPWQGFGSTDAAMAEKREEFGIVRRALGEFAPHVVDQAVDILRADALYRSEKVLGPAEWLQARHREAASTSHRELRDNLLWRAVALAPSGFCHPRASMIGTLLDDLAAGLPFEDVKRRFAAKMHPLQYQRPTAAPSDGNVARAERIIAQLGLEPALRRRFATVDEIVAVWRKPPATKRAAGPGVFDHLRAKAAPKRSAFDAGVITWRKFAQTVLPEALEIEINVPAHGDFVGLTAAADPTAPPIIQWDRPERRNPFAWYRYSQGSSAYAWNLSEGWHPVSAITLAPPQWYGDGRPDQGEFALFVIPGARDGRATSSMLFPELLRAELREVRATIEAHSRVTPLERTAGEIAAGLPVQDRPIQVRVTTAASVRTYRIDRWD